jgi:hypothetical protein
MKHGIDTRIKMAGASERGVVLPVVIGLGLAMLLLVAVGMSSATSGVIKTNNDENIKGAIAAAYAGVEEYQSRLALDSTYYKFGNPTAPFSLSSAVGLSLPAGSQSNPAFDATQGGSWATIPNPDGSAAATGAAFRYEVDNSDYASKGVIRLLSTGRVGNVTESVVANLKQSGFIDFLYFTDYETIDPILTSNRNVTLANGKNICEVHLWETPTRSSSCPRIQFGSFDTLAGPVHSNDTLLICGSTFLGTVTTSSISNPLYDKPNGCGAPVFKNPDGSANPSGAVNYEKSLDLPPTNSQMKKETYTDIPADVPNPGCLYTGPTTITFLSGGRMNVVSPYTKATQTNSASTVGTAPSKCGAISALRSTSGATIPVLDLNLVYVQAVPSTAGDPNYWGASSTPSGLSCLTQSGVAPSTGNSTYSGGFQFGGTQYPLANELLPASSTSATPAYSCRNGDLYVSGTLTGHTTLASDNYIYVTGDITYNDKTNDILGLVPLNALWVWNPITATRSNKSTSYNYAAGGNNREIDAAMLSVLHTVQVQNYDGNGTGLGSRGTLTILGAIAQKFRGTVATAYSNGVVATGYAKNYEYDERFRYTAPPKFLTPVSTTYAVTQYAGVKSGYLYDGKPVP